MEQQKNHEGHEGKASKLALLKKQLADLENEPIEDKPLSKVSSKGGSEPSGSDDDEKIEVKPKRERTEKQKEAFNKLISAKKEKAEINRKEKQRIDDEHKAEFEQKLIEKAIKVKKKQIKKLAVIEQLSDDDTPIEKPKASRPPPLHVKIPSSYRFV